MDVIIEPILIRFKVMDFLKRQENNGQSLESSEFTVNDTRGKSGNCALVIYPKGYDSSCLSFLSIYLENRSKNDLHLSFELRLEDKDEKHQENGIRFNIKIPPGMMNGYHKCLNIENLKRRANTLLPNGVLRLVLKPGPEPAAEPPAESAADFFVKDMETVWLDTDRDFSDIKISSNGKVFNCHRVLLAARSPVLRAMCETNFKEGNTREINMDSVDTQIVEVS